MRQSIVPVRDGVLTHRGLRSPDTFGICSERIAEVIAEFMEKYPPGDVIPMADIKEWISRSVGAAPGEEPAGAVSPDAESSMLDRFMAITALDENGLIETGAEGVVVQQHMDPEDVVLTLPAGAVEDIDPEILKEHGILAEITVTAVPEYRLEFGPDAVLGADLEVVDELVDDLEIDEDECMSFREGVSLKRVVTTRTLEILEERGTLAPEEVAEALGSGAVGGTEEGWSIVLDLTPEFVKGLITDLKKTTLVRKKGAGHFTLSCRVLVQIAASCETVLPLYTATSREALTEIIPSSDRTSRPPACFRVS